jgi:hypothetical protein
LLLACAHPVCIWQVENTREALGAIRTGRPSPKLFDKVMVSAYGSESPLPQVASPPSRLYPRALIPAGGSMRAVLEALGWREQDGWQALLEPVLQAARAQKDACATDACARTGSLSLSVP